MFTTLIFIIGFFLLGLFVRNFSKKVCAICLAVSLSWLYGLFAGWNPVVLAMLMGGSAVGLMYYWGGKWPEKFGFFKLPYLLTAFVVIQLILEKSFETKLLVLLGGTWLVFFIIYGLRRRGGKKWFEKVVECCKNW